MRRFIVRLNVEVRPDNETKETCVNTYSNLLDHVHSLKIVDTHEHLPCEV